MTPYQQYIHQSRYARWLPTEGRRETWDETVDRYLTFFFKQNKINEVEYAELRKAIYDMDVMPSMRALSSAGPALERDAMAGYNCSYIAVDDVRAFDEILFVLMNGTGVGFSVERQHIGNLPSVPEEILVPEEGSDLDYTTFIEVDDSKEGWASAYRELINLLYRGIEPYWCLEDLRPEGAPLLTFGGRSSGPEPLNDLFEFTVHTFRNALGRRLTSLECHDLICKIASIVVVGGVRRSALISLSNLSDDRMRAAKTGQWWVDTEHRALSNNSAVYTERPDFDVFLKEWQSLHESKSGERGIFSRTASQAQAGLSGRRDTDYQFGTNPCSEIILRSCQVCNLTEGVVREDDTLSTLTHKVRLATILGTLQATLTDFRYVRDIWKKNTEEERLLGVSLTGIMDNLLTSDQVDGLEQTLCTLRQVAIDTNKEWADRLGINQSTAITCVKPSGTVSQLVDSSSGIHARYAEHYIRRVRNDIKDPLTQFLIDQGVPHEEDKLNPATYVFSFPQKAPLGSVVTDDMTAAKQLALNKIYESCWAEHKISQTVFYDDDEFLTVGQWVWDNLETSSGVSFLPRNTGTYQQAPYETITETEYDELVASMPTIEWSKLSEYEKSDMTTGTQTLACTGDKCEI